MFFFFRELTPAIKTVAAKGVVWKWHLCWLPDGFEAPCSVHRHDQENHKRTPVSAFYWLDCKGGPAQARSDGPAQNVWRGWCRGARDERWGLFRVKDSFLMRLLSQDVLAPTTCSPMPQYGQAQQSAAKKQLTAEMANRLAFMLAVRKPQLANLGCFGHRALGNHHHAVTLG